MRANLDHGTVGREMHDLVAELYPICRSITGEGVRETLRRVQRLVPLTLHEVPSGTPVLDWTVPPEWNVRDAYVKNRRGERVIDFRRSNLHLLNYSVPFHGTMSLEALRPHLFTMPDRPDWIPYRTAYYDERWGFCVSQRALDALEDGEYEVCIDVTRAPGSLTYGECYLPGETAEEVLISCHICHPSLANDNLSGLVVATYLAERLARCSRRYSYRVLFMPGTIGSITWLSRNESGIDRIRHGLVLAGLGDPGRLSYKKSRRGNAPIDQAATHFLRQAGDHEILEFAPYGYDERQFCSPGFDLPVGRLSRTPDGRYPEYHTSADDLDFIQPLQLAASLAACLGIADLLESDRTYVNQSPKGEPQLGRRGLYRPIGGVASSPAGELAMLWMLNLSDGRHRLLDIAERSRVSFDELRRAAEALRESGLLKETC
jgi:aminopeptidase-like protein